MALTEVAAEAHRSSGCERFAALRDTADTLRRHVIQMAADSAGVHVGGCMSAVEILAVLYFDGVLRVDPAEPKKEGRDVLIFSKGHASAVFFAALAERGFFPVAELGSYKQMGSARSRSRGR